MINENTAAIKIVRDSRVQDSLPPASSGTPMPKIKPAAQPVTNQQQSKPTKEKE